MRISDWSSDVCSSDLVPMSITAVTGDFMRDVGANTIADVSAYIPNVKFSSATDPALGQINIRGFGTSPLNSGFESSVGFVEDDLFLARSPYITDRSEERRVGKEGVSTCKSRGSP